ncbi:MAG: Crp/Fnr family transcriptional regulator [Clostridia bacterium]|nr:Crp/Fnr family transcriptional regulator [Clostridia bacterium]
MKKYSEILKKCILFKDIDEDSLISMLSCINARIREYNKNELIFTEGSSADKIGIVLSGTVQVERVDYYGNRSILTSIKSSQIFGESFACSGKKFLVDIIATERCEVMLIDIHRAIHTCSNACDFHNKLIFNLLKAVANKNLILNKKIEATSKRTTKEKLLSYLSIVAKEEGRNSFTIPFDRQELADYLEVDRSGLSKEIGKLRAEGILESKGSYFKLLKNS